MLLSAVVVIGVSIWMFLRTRAEVAAADAHQHAPHGGKVFNTGHGIVELEVFENGVPPRFRLHSYDLAMAAKAFDANDVGADLEMNLASKTKVCHGLMFQKTLTGRQ